MQPDSIRPAARTPNFAFKDDMSSSNRNSLQARSTDAPQTPKLIGNIYPRNPSQFYNLATYPVTLSVRLCPFCRCTATFCLEWLADRLQLPHRRYEGAASPPQNLKVG